MKDNFIFWFAIIMVASFIGISTDYYISEQSAIKKAVAGLEECPKRSGAITTIWVKDCNSYLKNITRLEK